MYSNARPKFTEDDLRSEIELFFRESGNKQLPMLKLTDDPASFEERDQAHGRYWFRENGAKDRYYPYADSKGVYFFFGKDKLGVYVGQSSEGENSMGYRIGDHLGHIDDPGHWIHDADYVISIPFDEDPGMASVFESYLLENYTFCGNTVGQ